MVREGEATKLDVAPHKAWRRFVPKWLRSLIWLDSAASYDAFLSYSWKSDKDVAPVIQSVLQGFLRPWNRPRGKAIFRDLSCMPAGSSLERELSERLDRSSHFIVLASPEAAKSWGMEMEARHWFSRPRSGEVLIIVTNGEFQSWKDICERLLPAAISSNLPSEPLWIPLQHRRSQILADPRSPALRGGLIEDLRQVFLRLYAPRTWEELHGEERKQRHRVLGIVSAVAMMLLGLAVAAGGLAWFALDQRKEAEERAKVALSRQLAIEVIYGLPSQVFSFDSDQAQTFADDVIKASGEHTGQEISGGYNTALALLLSAQAARTSPTVEARSALLHALRFQPYRSFFLWGDSNGAIIQAAITSDDHALIALLSDGSVIRRDLDSGDSWHDTSSARQNTLKNAVLSPTGRFVAYQSSDAIVLEELSTHKSLDTTIHVHGDDEPAIAFSPDEKFMAVVSPDGSAVVWDVTGGRVWKELPGEGESEPDSIHANEHATVALGANGTVLAFKSIHIDGGVVVWDVGSATPDQRILKAPFGEVTGIALHDNLLAAASGSFPGSSGLSQPQGVVVWDLRTNEATASSAVEAVDPPNCVGFSADGKTLAVGFDDTKILLLSSDTLDAQYQALNGLPEGLRCSLTVGTHTVAVGDLTNLYVADVAGPTYLTVGESSGSAVPLRAASDRSADAFAVSPDGNTVVSEDETNGTLVIRDSRSQKTIGSPVKVDFDHLGSVAVSPGGNRLAECDDQGKVTLWDTATGKSTVLESDSFGGGLPAFSLDGKTLALGTEQGNMNQIILWDVAAQRNLGALSSGVPQGSFNSIAFSPDGKTIASSSFKSADIVLWDVSARKSLAYPLSVVGGPDDDDSVGEAMNAVAFARDGKTLLWEQGDAADARNQDIVSLDVDTDSWIKRACRIANRNLTCAEWKQYVGNEPYEQTCPNLPAAPNCK